MGRGGAGCWRDGAATLDTPGRGAHDGRGRHPRGWLDARRLLVAGGGARRAAPRRAAAEAELGRAAPCREWEAPPPPSVSSRVGEPATRPYMSGEVAPPAMPTAASSARYRAAADLAPFRCCSPLPQSFELPTLLVSPARRASIVPQPPPPAAAAASAAARRCIVLHPGGAGLLVDCSLRLWCSLRSGGNTSAPPLAAFSRPKAPVANGVDTYPPPPLTMAAVPGGPRGRCCWRRASRHAVTALLAAAAAVQLLPTGAWPPVAPVVGWRVRVVGHQPGPVHPLRRRSGHIHRR